MYIMMGDVDFLDESTYQLNSEELVGDEAHMSMDEPKDHQNESKIHEHILPSPSHVAKVNSFTYDVFSLTSRYICESCAASDNHRKQAKQ